MKEEEEDLELNPFLKSLRNKCPDLHQLAADEQLVICVPSAPSTEGLPLNRATFENHILRASPFFAGIYETVGGRTVDLEDSTIETKDGFPEKRKVKILFEELHYNSDYQPFRILCISQPFQGGSQYSANTKNMDQELISEKETLKEYKQLLQLLHLDDRKPITQGETQIRELFRTYVFAKGYLDHANGKLANIFDKATRDLILSNRAAIESFGSGQRVEDVLRVCVETLLMETAHQKLMKSISQMYGDEDKKVELTFDLKKAHSVSEIGADKRIRCDFSKAINLAKSLDSLPTPLDKISLLRDVALAINDSVEQGKKKGSVPQSLMLAADDLLPLNIYTFVQARPDRLYSNAILLNHFGAGVATSAEAGFHIANLMAVADYLLSESPKLAISRPAPIVVKEPTFQVPEPTSSGGNPGSAMRDHGMGPDGVQTHGAEARSSQKSGSSRPSEPVEADEGTWLPSPQREASGGARGVGAGSWGAEALTPSRSRRPPDIIGNPSESDDVSQLGDFLLALRNEDTETSSGRGLPF